MRSRRPTTELQAEEAHSPDLDGQIQVARTLQRLKPDQRALLALALGEGLSYRETAAALSIPEGTVSSRLNTAKVAFRKLWEED